MTYVIGIALNANHLLTHFLTVRDIYFKLRHTHYLTSVCGNHTEPSELITVKYSDYLISLISRNFD